MECTVTFPGGAKVKMVWVEPGIFTISILNMATGDSLGVFG